MLYNFFAIHNIQRHIVFDMLKNLAHFSYMAHEICRPGLPRILTSRCNFFSHTSFAREAHISTHNIYIRASFVFSAEQKYAVILTNTSVLNHGRFIP